MKAMVIALACLVFVALVFLIGNKNQTWLNAAPLAAVGNSGNPVPDTDNLQTIITDGTEMTFDEFKKKAPAVAQLLTPLQPTRIRRDGNRFTLTTTPATIAKQGVTVYVSGKVSCEATKSGNVITLKKIEGVEVSIGVGGKLKLRESVITPGGNNTATVDGKLEVSRWLPYIPFSVTVDTDKNP
jgi:hypothetical protein